MLEGWLEGGFGVLLLGLGIGMQHALEADHIAAVSSIAAKETSVRRIVTHGVVWGLGHTATLVVVAGCALAFGLAITDELAGWLELLVGVMLIVLGGHLVVTLVRDRVHAHRHYHRNGTMHWHAHSHRDEDRPHDLCCHVHHHRRGLPVRSLLVGMMHGIAGSAALLILTAASFGSAVLGVSYIILFGLGSIFGMAVLSTIIAVPLAWSSRALSRVNGCLRSAIGVGTVILGVTVVDRSLHDIARVSLSF